MSSIRLYGRNEEVSTLRTCFERLTKTRQTNTSFDFHFESNIFLSTDIQKELVLIQGISGVGKSSLAKAILDDVRALENGLFVEGKFDLMTSNEPYSGVAKAFGTICRELLSSSKESVAAVGRTISNELRDEVQTLLPLIPELKAIITTHTGLRRKPYIDGEKRRIENGQERLKHAFRRLVRALNSAFSPICLVLDDLQWADQASLQVIDYLVSDIQNPNLLMIIGCFRSEEVLEHGELLSRIKKLKEKERRGCPFKVTEIKLGSCQVVHVNKIIMTTMSIDNENETEELASICYRRTLGNPFFILQFISMLENEGLMKYDASLSKWSWNVDEIERHTKYTSDVVDLLQGRMRKMPTDVQILLQYAACLGASFSFSTLDIIWNEHGTNGANVRSNIYDLLHIVENEKFIEENSTSGYRWAHDKVQEAAISLSSQVNAAFKFKIGKTLVSALDEEQLEDELFDVVDLINRGNVATRPELASLNLRAAKKAQSLSAFQSAAKYVEFGAALLPRSHWESHRKLTLDLYTLGAEVELALGHTQEAAGYCSAVIEREDCSTMEKLPLQMAVIKRLCQGDSNMKMKALDMTLKILKELGFRLVWNKKMLPLQMLLSLVGTMKATKKWLSQKDNEASIGDMTDPRSLAIMNLLARVADISYHCELIFLSALSSCHMVKMTLKHGKCSLSTKAIADIGIAAWLVLNEDFNTVLACAEAAMAMQKSVDSQYEGQATWDAYALVLSWAKPLHSCVSPLQNGYESAMKEGDVEYAMWNLGGLHVWLPYVRGKPIQTILQDMPKIVSQMEENQQEDQTIMVRMYWQSFLNMTSETCNCNTLEGSVFSLTRFPLTKGPLLGNLHFLEGELLFLTSFEMAAKRAIKHGNKFQKLCCCVFVGMIELFHRGVALYAMARRDNKEKYRKAAIKIRKTVKQWIKDGNPNVEHYDLLLDAEHAALHLRSNDAAKDLYERAIECACKLNHLHHCAVANERYADFLLCTCSDEAGASYRYAEAARFYEIWGAIGKAHQLQRFIKW